MSNYGGHKRAVASSPIPSPRPISQPSGPSEPALRQMKCESLTSGGPTVNDPKILMRTSEGLVHIR